MAKTLKKPLRPLWLSQSSFIWINEVANPQDLRFTPLILISASPGASSSTQQQSHDSHDLDALLQGQLVATAGRQDQGVEGFKHASAQTWTYDYVPGAGDDHESWAGPLTPETFWKHSRAILEEGPSGVDAMIEKCLTREDKHANLRANTSAPVPIPLRKSCSSPCDWPSLSGDRPDGIVCRGGKGLTWIGELGLAVGGVKAMSSPGILTEVDAFLDCTLFPPECQNLQVLQHSVQTDMGTVPSLDDGDKGKASMSCMDPCADRHSVKPRSPILLSALNDESSLFKEDKVRGQEIEGSYGRYLWLPVKSCKIDRHSLEQQLTQALHFLSWHFERGHRVLVYDSGGNHIFDIAGTQMFGPNLLLPCKK